MGLSRRYIEGNIIDELAEIRRRLAVLERGAFAGSTGLILYEETTGAPYELIASKVEDRVRLYLRPLETEETEFAISGASE